MEVTLYTISTHHPYDCVELSSLEDKRVSLAFSSSSSASVACLTACEGGSGGLLGRALRTAGGRHGSADNGWTAARNGSQSS